MWSILHATLRRKKPELKPNLRTLLTACSLSLLFIFSLTTTTSSAYADTLDSNITATLPREVQDVLNDFTQTNGQPTIPTADEVNSRIKTVTDDSSLSDEEKAKIKASLQDELNFLQRYANAIVELQDLNTQIAHSQETLNTLNEQLEQATQEFSVKPQAPNAADQTLEELNAKITDISVRLSQSQSELADATSAYSSLQSLPTRVQNKLTSNNDRIYAIVKLINDSDTTGNSLLEYQKQALAFEAYVLQLESSIMSQRAQSVTFLQDKANYETRISTLKNNYYSEYLSELRNLQTELISNQAMALESQSSDNDFNQIPKLRNEVHINEQYADDVNQATLDNTNLNTEKRAVDNALIAVYQLEKTMNDQISDISESLLLSRLLNRQQSEIPKVTISFNLDEMLTNLTISLFDLRIQREALFDINSYVQNKIDIDPQLEPYTEQLYQIMQHRRLLIDQLYQLRSESLSLAVALRDKFNEFTNVASNVNTVINDNLFWLASNNGISIDFFTNFLSDTKKQIDSFTVKFNNPEKAKLRFMHWLSVLIPILLIGLIFYKSNPAIRRRINKLALRLDKANDNYFITPIALLYHLLVIIPLLSALTALGTCVIFLVLDDFKHQLEITCLLSLHLVCFLYIRNILDINSLAQRHFCFSIESNKNSRQIIDKIWFISIPMLLIANMRILEPTLIAGDLIGFTLMMLGFLYLTFFSIKTAKRHFETFTPTMNFWIMSTIGILTPLTLSFMLAIGYYYTVIQLLNRVAISLYIFFLYVITSNTLRRELNVAENRMVKAARERLLNSKNDDDNKKTGNRRIEANNFNNKNLSKRNTQVQALRLDLVNTRSFKLFNGFILCLFIYAIYLQWNDLAGVLNYLNNVYLWTKVSIVEGQEIITNYLSLGHLLLAIVIIIVTTILAKNLPNLLERLFLLRTNTNNKSTSYTVKIISFYFIACVGTILAAGVMGITWDNLQWLVAALSVGLGFGLQEIFGNFVSGIIILFERQLRVGDIVTLNSLSGTVSKIRIRATTIIAFDNKEVVIPNKQFITSALTNWSLSNTITKLEFEVGVAYDADIGKAKDLLRSIMRRCKNLNRDKKPVVYVKSLDASAITLLCEVYVNEIGKRKETFDYLSTETLRLFSEHNIEIPFDQLDITIRNLDNGETLTETQTNVIQALEKKKGTSISMKQSTSTEL